MDLFLALALTVSLAALGTPMIQRALAGRNVARRLARYCRQEEVVRADTPGRSLPMRLLIAIGRPLAGNGQSAIKLAADLRAANWLDRDAPAIFSGARMTAALSLGLVVGLLSAEGGLRNGALTMIVIFVLASRTLAHRARSRTLRMRAELPAAIDVLVMVLEGGAGVEQALRFSVGLAVHPAPLCQRAFQTFVQDLERGTPYEISLGRLGERLTIDEGPLFIEILRQALSHGTELQEPLKTLAHDLRQRRLADARASVGRATTMMTVVMVTCLLPALMTLIGAPAFSGIRNALGNMTR